MLFALVAEKMNREGSNECHSPYDDCLHNITS